MTTFVSLFTGGGLADVGARLAGCELLWGVELRSDIAAIATSNLPHRDRVYCQSVLDMDWTALERPGILWASPPCPSFSVAKANAKETEHDIAMAKAIASAISTLQPSVFILENVEGYKRSQRCLARFQTVPDWYELPSNNRLACMIVGNGVPCELARQFIHQLLEDAV